jgi:diguanylate cyclase (GGDEF)-like protein
LSSPGARRGLARRGRLEVARAPRALSLASSPDLAARLKSLRGVRSRLDRRAALVDILRATHSSLDPQKVAEFLVNWAPEWIPAPSWAVVSADPGRELTLLAERGLMANLVAPAHAIAAWVVRYGTEFWTGNLAQDSRVGHNATVAALGFPLSSRGHNIGALVALDPRPGAEPRLSPAVLEAWRALLEPAAIGLENALLVQRAEALSVTDDLTRLYNSRFLNQSLRRETKRASRSGKPLSLLFIDLDGFKLVNDTHGHLHGSRALVEAAALIRGSARETDVVARFGGDEFAVVLPETTGEGAWAVAERVRARIAEHRFLTGEGLDVHLTVSVGVATLPDVARSAEELLQAADRAMYHVKSAGKNGTQLAVD